jgi:hypothetical protein
VNPGAPILTLDGDRLVVPPGVELPPEAVAEAERLGFRVERAPVVALGSPATRELVSAIQRRLAEPELPPVVAPVVHRAGPTSGKTSDGLRTLGHLAGMAGAWSATSVSGVGLPMFRRPGSARPSIRNHTAVEALARAEEKRQRKAAARRGKP